MQKLQTLAVMEMEKSMMVAGRSIVVLETPMVPLKRTAPKRRNIIIISLFLGMFLSGATIYIRDYISNRYSSLLSSRRQSAI
jgi:uncharacterized protein involved in exopolysaccharide biosynthesis